jgi:hypothetical protein
MCHCGEEEKAKGLCSRHYLADYRIRKSQGLIKKTETILLVEATYNDTPTCGICGDTKRAKNLCTKHYFQLRRSQ